MQNIINYNLYKRNSTAPNLNEGNNSKETFINLKYPGQKGEQLMSKMKKIVSNSLENGVKPKDVYNSAKLSLKKRKVKEIFCERKISEALLINELKPSLNKQDKSFPLKLFN